MDTAQLVHSADYFVDFANLCWLFSFKKNGPPKIYGWLRSTRNEQGLIKQIMPLNILWTE